MAKITLDVYNCLVSTCHARAGRLCMLGVPFGV